MNKFKLVFLVLLLIFGGFLIVIFSSQRLQTPLEHSFVPLFKMLGQSTDTISTVAGEVLMVDDIDESKFGDEIAREYYDSLTDKEDMKTIYLNTIIKELSSFSQKKFKYKVYVREMYSPNAYALPGGIIVVSNELLDVLKSESELVSVLSHEMGHIENGHCLNSVKYQIFTEKIRIKELGQLADIAVALMLRHSYSKTMEDEADEFAFNVITNTRYDLYGVSNAFQSLKDYVDSQPVYSKENINDLNIVRDYFSSHPPLELRISKYLAAANRKHTLEYKGPARYMGVRNLDNYISFYNKKFDSDWIKN